MNPFDGLTNAPLVFSEDKPRDENGRFASGGGGGGGGGGSDSPSGAARGKIKDVTIKGADLKSATVVDLPDTTLGGNPKLTSNLLGDHVTFGGESGRIVQIDPKGESMLLQARDGSIVSVKVPPPDPKLREAMGSVNPMKKAAAAQMTPKSMSPGATVATPAGRKFTVVFNKAMSGIIKLKDVKTGETKIIKHEDAGMYRKD